MSLHRYACNHIRYERTSVINPCIGALFHNTKRASEYSCGSDGDAKTGLPD